MNKTWILNMEEVNLGNLSNDRMEVGTGLGLGLESEHTHVVHHLGTSNMKRKNLDRRTIGLFLTLVGV